MAASSLRLGGRAEASAGVIGRDELDREDVLARPPVAAMAAVPRTGAASSRPVGRANAILDPTRAGDPAATARPVGRVDPDGAGLDEPARVAEAWLEPLDALEIERQLAAEEAAVGQVVADDPGQRERGQRARDLVARPAGRRRERLDPEPRLPAERAADRGDGRRPARRLQGDGGPGPRRRSRARPRD